MAYRGFEFDDDCMEEAIHDGMAYTKVYFDFDTADDCRKFARYVDGERFCEIVRCFMEEALADGLEV